MNYQLELNLDNQPAVLERVLQTTRYRGFELKDMNVELTDQNSLRLLMTVSGQHPINILTTQLNKLYDLASLTFEQSMPLKSSA